MWREHYLDLLLKFFCLKSFFKKTNNRQQNLPRAVSVAIAKFSLFISVSSSTGSVSGSGDVTKLQVFAAAPDETKLRARPRPPVLETA